MRVKLRQPAPEGSRFAPTAFARSVDSGRPITLRGVEAYVVAEGRLLSAEVIDDGAAVILELDFPDLEVF